MGLISRLAGEVGSAIGTYQRHLARALGSLRRPGFLTAWADSERWQGGDWTQRNAQRRSIQSSWYFAAISALQDIIIQANFQVVSRANVDEEPFPIPNHPLEKLIRRPNPWMGRAFLWEYSYWWLRLDGNFYWFIACDENGRVPLELWPLPANDVVPVPGDKERFIDYYEYTVNGMIYKIPAEYVVHVRRPNPFNIFDGLSDLVPGMLPIDSDLAMSRWNGQFFGKDNVMPSAVINLSSGDPKQPINPADAEALKHDLRNQYQAYKRRTAVTSAYKVEVEKLGWNNRDMDFISGRGFTKEEIWAVSRVHAGAFDPNSTEANANVGERRIRETVWGDLTRIAEQLTTDLVIPFYGSQYEATFEDVRIADRQLEMTEVERSRGVLTVNEVRQRYFGAQPLDDPRGEALYGAVSPAQEPIPYYDVGRGQSDQEKPNGPDQNPGSSPNPGFLRPDSGARETMASAIEDLRRWRSKSLRSLGRGKSASVPFESEYIFFEAADAIHRLLATAKDPDQVKLIFDHAEKVVKAAPRPWRPWSVFENKLLDRLTRFFSGESHRLQQLVKQDGPQVLSTEAAWLEHEQKLANELAPIMDSLSRFAVGQVQEMVGAQVPQITNWELVNRNAAEYARQYSADLVSDITDTTRARLREAVATWTESGEGIGRLTDRIDEIVDDRSRARLIAISESTTNFAESSDRAWTAMGYAPAVYKPAAHPNCRCYPQPARLPDGSKVQVWYTVRDERVCRQSLETPWGRVEGCRDLHLTIISDGPWLGKKLR